MKFEDALNYAFGIPSTAVFPEREKAPPIPISQQKQGTRVMRKAKRKIICCVCVIPKREELLNVSFLCD